MTSIKFTHTVTERFLRYAVIDTQSDPASPTCPSTAKQKNLGALLASELQAIGVRDADVNPESLAATLSECLAPANLARMRAAAAVLAPADAAARIVERMRKRR